VFNNFFNVAIDEIKRKNIVEGNRLVMAKWRMRLSCWVSNATNAYTQVV
jgi:hypothetical protein